MHEVGNHYLHQGNLFYLIDRNFLPNGGFNFQMQFLFYYYILIYWKISGKNEGGGNFFFRPVGKAWM